MWGPKQPKVKPGRDEELLVHSAARKALEQELVKHELTARMLPPANEDLLRQMAERDRREHKRSVAERDLHDVQARFESAFTGAPIGHGPRRHGGPLAPGQ